MRNHIGVGSCISSRITIDACTNPVTMAQRTASREMLADYAETIKQLSSEKERILERLAAAETARDEAQDRVLSTEMEKRDAQDELRRAQARIEDLQGAAGN